jgi:uncharacterized coiled-coil protein SlyX
LETNSASVNISISALNTFTASQSTASLVNSITELNTFSASAKTSISELNTNSASVNTSISNLNSFTQSQEGVNLLLAGEIDSLQDKTGSYATTGSNNFIGNQTITGNITAFSASFTYLQTIFESSSIIYSSGSNQFGDELTDVQTLSGSVKVEGSLTVNGTPVLTSSVDISGLVTTASFNAYTESNDSKVNSLIAATASYADSASVAAVDAAQQSQIDSLIAATSSYADSASFAASQLVQDGRLNNLESTSASVNISITNLNASSASQQVSIDALNTFTASQSTASLVNSINELNQFSSSTLIRLTNIESTTSSLNTSVNNINSATASLFTSASLSLTTASFAAGTLTFTKGDNTTFGVVIPDVSGSAGTTIFEVVYTGENITKGDPLYISGSQGANPKVFKADAADPNKMPVTFVSNETIGVANTTEAIVLGLIEGINLTGYIAGQTIYVAEGGGWSANLPSGSNSVTQLLGVVTKGGNGGKGLVLNPGPAQLPGLDSGKLWVGGANNQPIEITTASFASSASFNAYTSSNNQRVDSLESNSASVNISISNLNSTTQSLNTSVSNLNSTTESLNISVTNLNASSASQQVSIDALNVFTASQSTASLVTSIDNLNQFTQSAGISIAALNAATSSYVTSAITASSLVTASYFNDVNIRFTKGDGTTFDVAGIVSTGSSEIYGTLTFNEDVNAGMLFPMSGSSSVRIQKQVGINTLVWVAEDNEKLLSLNLDTDTFSVSGGFDAGLQEGYAWVGQSNNRSQAVPTSSFIGTFDSSSLVTTASFNAYTSSTNQRVDSLESNSASVNTSITNINSATASLFTSASLALVTASVSGTTLTFTKGDASTFNVTLPTGSGGGTIDTGSFATTGSNSFNGDQNITGSIRYSQQLLVGTTNLGPSIQALDSGTPAGMTGLQVNAGESGSFTMRTLFGGGIGQATLEAYNTFPSFNSGGKIFAKSAGGVNIEGYSGEIAITGSNTKIQGLTYPNTDGTNGQVLTTNGSGILSFTTVSGSGGTIDTGSLMVTGSVSGNVLTFTKGDASTFSLTVATGSGGGGSGSAFPFSGSAEITGSLSVSETVQTQIYLTPQTLTGPLSVPTGFNGMLTGPVSNSGIITIESGSTLVII